MMHIDAHILRERDVNRSQQIEHEKHWDTPFSEETAWVKPQTIHLAMSEVRSSTGFDQYPW